MHVEALGSKCAVVCPRHASPTPGRRRLPALLATAALGALAPGLARAQFERFVDVPGPTGVAVEDTGDVIAVAGQPNRLVRFAPDGKLAGEAALPDDLARSRIAIAAGEGFQGAVILSPAGRLEIVPAAQGAAGTAFELGRPEAPVQVDAPDLDAGGARAPLTLVGARFDDVAIAPLVPVAKGAPVLLDLFLAGATAGTGANGAGARPFLVRLQVDVAGQQAMIRGIATTQGNAADPRAPSGVGVTFQRDDKGAVTDALVVTSMPTKTHATAQGAGWTLVAAGAQFPEDTRPERAPAFRSEEQRIESPGMTSDDRGNLYLIVAEGACAGSDGPGLRVISPTDTLCALLPATTASGSADVGVARAGDPIYVDDEEGNAIVVSAAPPNVTPGAPAPTASRSAAPGWSAAAGEVALR